MKLRFATMAIISSFCLMGTASASIVGTLLTGSAGDITVSNAGITWNTDPSSTPAGPPWNGEVANGTNLSFVGCPSGVLNSAGCLSVTEAVEINHALTLSPGSILPIDGFLLFANHGNLDFKLVDVLAGSNNTNCAGLVNVGDSCSPFLGSPIILTLQAGGRTSATVNFDGVASDNGGVTFTSTWVGGFGATVNKLPSAIQAEFCTVPASGPVLVSACTSTINESTSNSGSFFATATPEPGSLALIGGGLIGLAALLRRKKSV